MKNYTITVNGNVYDVTVEEGKSTGSKAASAPAAKVAPSIAPKKPAAPAAAGSIVVNAPMPGKVLSITASVGDSVKKGDTILVFEAMKMENSLTAPEDGTVASISVVVGESFDAGVAVATLK